MDRVLKFVGVGLTAAIVDYVVYELCLIFLFGNDVNLVPVAQVISLLFSTLTAFLLHKNITWRDRDPGKYGIIKFFIWNLVIMLSLRAFLSWLFGLLTGLYEFVFFIFGSINIPFSIEFIQSTGIFAMMNIVTMVINFFFYNNFIFGKRKESSTKKKSSSREKSPSEKALPPEKESKPKKKPEQTTKRKSEPEADKSAEH